MTRPNKKKSITDIANGRRVKLGELYSWSQDAQIDDVFLVINVEKNDYSNRVWGNLIEVLFAKTQYRERYWEDTLLKETTLLASLF